MKSKVELYSPYSNPPPQVGQRNTAPGMTQQHFANETDINQILSKFIRTGFLDTVGPGYYDDVSESFDYRQAIHLVQAADQKFGELPAELRKYFENDPGRFMDFIHNPDNREKAIEIGLIPAPPPPQPPTNTEPPPSTVIT